MADFKKIFEDLASGRPAKKPVSGNLLKQRAKENEKALKSGFMKMPDYVKKKFNEEEEMKPHKMYKGDKVVVAKNKAEHDKLNKQGYTHDDPKTKKVEEAKEMCSCDCDCGKAICESCGKPKTVKEDIRRGMPFVGTKDTPGGKGKVRNLTVLKNKGVPLSKLKPQQKNVEKKSIQQQINKEDKNWPRPFTKDERQEFLDKAHAKAGYKKKSGTGLKKVKGGYERKTTYTKESTRDNYNPVTSAKVTKEKLKKVGLPTEPPIVKEAKKPIVDLDKAGIRDRLKTVKIKYNKPIKTKVTDIGPGGKEYVRKDWSEGIERDPKSNSFNRTKAKKTKVKLGTKSGKPVYGTTTTPQGFPGLREQQMQLVTNLDFNEGLTNLVSRGLDKVRSSIKDAEKRTGLSVDASKNNKNNPVSGKNIAKRLASQKKR